MDNLTPEQMPPYSQIYGSGFFNESDGHKEWNQGKMRLVDTVAALAYALGWPSYEEVQKAFGFTDARAIDTRSAIEQIEVLTKSTLRTRWPKSVLDIGGGRGELACAFNHLYVPVQVVEPHPDAAHWMRQTSKNFYGYDVFEKPKAQFHLYEHVARSYIMCCGVSDGLPPIDTVMMVESIEHIPEKEFDASWDWLKETLFRNHGVLIVTNWIDFHPISVEGPMHCRRIDDDVYEKLAGYGEVVYQRGSHLVVQF